MVLLTARRDQSSELKFAGDFREQYTVGPEAGDSSTYRTELVLPLRDEERIRSALGCEARAAPPLRSVSSLLSGATGR